MAGELEQTDQRRPRAIQGTAPHEPRHSDPRAKDTSPGSNVEFILDSFRSSPGFPRLTGDDLSLISRVCSSPAFSGPADFGGLGAGDFEDIELLAFDR